jgi:toxin ParE1/3/4
MLYDRYWSIGGARFSGMAATHELVISRTPLIVVYRIKDQRIELLRLLHGSQTWP